ncbi:MAG: hypothetical protein AB1758_05905 [Candidatus Eremiobacterota bacterium]
MRKLLLMVALFSSLSLALPAQPTDHSPEAFVKAYMAAWARGDFATTYAMLSRDLRKELTQDQHAKSLERSIQTPEARARLLGCTLVAVEPSMGPRGPDANRKKVRLRYPDGAEGVMFLTMEEGHWKLLGP